MSEDTSVPEVSALLLSKSDYTAITKLPFLGFRVIVSNEL